MPEPTPILLERRFPVGLSVSIEAIRDLYEESKQAAWNPSKDIDWGAFDTQIYSDEERAAARLEWSRRAWVVYTGLAETPSVLVRFCLERGREADPKFFLTVRNTEEAWHIECCHRVAELLGGYIQAPANSDYAALLNQSFHREVLHADTPLDAYFVAHCLIAEALELALWEAYLANARSAVVRAVLEHTVKDKRRHARFGAIYVDHRAASWSETERKAIADYVNTYLVNVELRGYQCASFAPAAQVADLTAAAALCASAGLGAIDAEAERRVFAQTLNPLTDQLRNHGIDIDTTSDLWS